jgi:hypothetical protein
VAEGGKMRFLSFIIISFIVAYSTLGYSGDLISFEADTLLDQKVSLPKVFSEGPGLLLIGFTKASQKAISQCGDKFEELLPNQPYCAAVLQGAPFFIKGIIKNGIRSTVPEKRRSRFLIFNDGKDELKKLAGFTEISSDDAYWIQYIPDEKGQYVATSIGHGICDSKQMESVKIQLQKLKQPVSHKQESKLGH